MPTRCRGGCLSLTAVRNEAELSCREGYKKEDPVMTDKPNKATEPQTPVSDQAAPTPQPTPQPAMPEQPIPAQPGSVSAQPSEQSTAAPISQPATAPAPAPAQSASPASAPQPASAQPAVVPGVAPQPAPAPVSAPGANPYAAPAPGAPVQQNPYQPQPMPAYMQPNKQPGTTAPLVFGILSIVLAPFFCLVGLAFGIVAILKSSSAIKRMGKMGKLTAAKITGIVGTALSALFIVLGILTVIGAFSLAGSSAISAVDSSSSSSTGSASAAASSSLDYDSLTADEKSAADQASQLLESLTNQDPDQVAALAERADKSFDASFGYSITDMGENPEDYVKWMLTDFSYTIDACYDNGDGTFSVYADVDSRDTFEFTSAFYDDMRNWDSSMSDEQLAQKLSDTYTKALANTTDMSNYYAQIVFTKQGDSVVLDQDYWNDEQGYLFGFMD